MGMVRERYHVDNPEVDQFVRGPIIYMIENYLTGSLWDLFMSCEEVQEGLDRFGFRY